MIRTALSRLGSWRGPKRVRHRSPHIGRPGYPAHRTFQWGLKNLYGGCADPRVDSGFTAIAWDEGFLDEVWGYEPYTSGTASRTT